ncbi:MAG: protein phosphatase CheZ [Rhodanobacter sp.]
MSKDFRLAIDDGLPPQLRDLLSSADGPAFEQALDVIVCQRERHLFRLLGHLARDLHDALRRLGAELAHEGVAHVAADARQHLQDVLDMSAQAANRSLDFAERMRPDADALVQHANAVLECAGVDGPALPLARRALEFGMATRAALADMVLAQSWQDLSGQRINKVGAFIACVESSLLELVRLAGKLAGDETADGTVQMSSQADADRLLAEFGF